ncbi:hypothetical protein ACOI1H_13300 [Loktanella sp. DJP18]|uniref:hypothetical protein n=1 Tax=Loktanella sp. DJP18 TaxID=3409788 RepID=UPI003BB6419F
MFFKDIIMLYGIALSGKAPSDRDPVATIVPEEMWRPFREQMFEDISQAAIYSLDNDAARYADSFRYALIKDRSPEEGGRLISQFMEEVALPHDLIWVEHHHGRLTAERLRNYGDAEDDIDPGDFGRRGFLIDNRSPETLKVTMFREDGRSDRFIDPITHILFLKNEPPSGHAGASRMSHVIPGAHEHMLYFFGQSDMTQAHFDRLEGQEIYNASCDVVISFIVFALIASRQNGLVQESRPSLSTSEIRTARKFGKSWMTERLRTHVIIRIGPEAQRHLHEQSERRKHESAVASGRLPPTEHWVSEHERHYKSGKVVLIKAYQRGVIADPDLPRLVVGPGRA